MTVNSEKVLSINFSNKQRAELLNTLKSTDFDICIIGGGITGAGVARDAVMRGLNVALIEKSDFGEGTSSRSSKLFHGGLRYLKSFEIKLVEEATRERNWERDDALPHNVRPLHLLVPVYTEQVDPRTGKIIPASKWDLTLVKTALKLYDEAGKNQNYGPWEVIDDPKRIAELEPELNHQSLVGIGLYYDTNMDDARIVVETIKECVASGKCTALNYVKAIGFTHNANGIIDGVKVVEHDKFSLNEPSKPFIIRANAVVNCTGVWADEVLDLKGSSRIMAPSKGIHFTVKIEDLPVNHGFGLTSIDDGRFFFVIPRENWILIGTTDTFYDGDLDNPVTSKEEVDYLRNTVEFLFPNARIDDDHILGTYAGIRPLVREPGKEEGAISRKHVFFERDDGLFSLLGGKYTTFRVMAEDLMRKCILRSKKVDLTRNGTKQISSAKNIARVPYKIALKYDEFKASSQYQSAQGKIHPEILSHLYIEFGKGALPIIDAILRTPDLGTRLLEGDPEYPPKYFPWVKAEILYIVKHELPRHLRDTLCRRTEICWLVHPSKQRKVAEATAELMGDLLGWDLPRKKAEIEYYLDYIQANSYFYTSKV
ncbi:MAG: glycerol-3-phosphate dehydrogenase/oxidase [Promethearchaeota archaeon]|nr:MAG: glycerol-3-phosphate dehydrogenase/oxidase [Candidatus Lokiarchaeota archaeon]